MRFWKFLLPLIATSLSFASLSFAAQPDRIAGPIDSSRMAVLPGHIHHLARPEYDQGVIEPTYQFGHITMLLTPSASQQQAMDLLAAQQQDPKSPNFHKWLTPEQFATRFGLSQNDLQKITAWLESEGLQVVSVARGGQFIVIGGSAAQVQNAFQTEIHRYDVEGDLHFANATMPSIPAALSGIVGGLRGLNDFRLKPALKRHPDYTVSGVSTHFLAPGDLYTIYDITPLQNSGINGAGQKIAILGQTDLLLTDINDYRSDFGLPAINLQQILVPGTGDPGVGISGDLGETDLDLEVSGSIAPNASIIFVYAGFTGGGQGIGSSTEYAIDQDVAPVISVSYGNCELGSTDSTIGSLVTQDLLFKQAAMQGISFFASAGDDGPATCDVNDNTQPVPVATQGLAVDWPGSSEWVTAVGGTEFDEGAGSYWNATNAANGGSAISYIPEKSWNDFIALKELDGGGGGPSNCFNQDSTFTICVSGNPKPTWQTGTGVPTDGVRDLPDISLSASNFNDPYVVCTPLEVLNYPGDKGDTTSSCASGITSAIDLNSAFGGTSASTPLMAGITVLLNQYLNGTSAAGLGLINPTLYTLAGTTPSAFHDTPVGSNSIVNCTPGTPAGQPVDVVCPSTGANAGKIGFDTTAGYDVVTGLGSVDANALAVAWAATLAPDFQFAAGAPSPAPVPAGQITVATLNITALTTGSTGKVVNFSPSSCTGLPSGASCSFSPPSVTFDGTDPASTQVTISTLANMTVPTVAQTITITPTNSPKTTATLSLSVAATNQSFTIASTSANTFSVTPGATATIPITVTGVGSPMAFSPATLPLTYTCTQSSLPSEASCSFSPQNGESVSGTTVTLSLITTGPTSQLRAPLKHRSGVFYALLLPAFFGPAFFGPGFLGIVFAGSRFRALGMKASRMQNLRVLGLMMVLGLFTFALGSCGGGSNNSGQKNAGTPAGSYKVIVNATTAGPNALTSTLTINLTVQ